MSKQMRSFVTGLKYASIISKSLGISFFNKDSSKKYLFETLGSIPGISAKAAQLLSMKVSNNEPIKIEPMPIQLVKAIIAESSPLLHQDIDEIDPEAKTASLGQVHFAMLKNGDEVAIKIQYPGIVSELKNQVNLMGHAANFGPPKKYQLAINELKDYFEDHLLAETNYLYEAENQELARTKLNPQLPICIPKIYKKYCTTNVLVQSFERSTELSKIKLFWPAEAKRDSSTLFMHYMLHSLFQSKFIHSDLHPKNYGFRTLSQTKGGYSHELVLYDFGSVLKIDETKSSYLYQLIQGTIEGRDINPFDILVALDFDPTKLKHIMTKLPALCHKMLEPFLTEGSYSIAGWHLKDDFNAILGDDKWWFRTAGSPWFLMLMRSIQGILYFSKELQQSAPLRILFSDMSPPQYFAVKPVVGFSSTSTKTLAKFLLVQVTENSTQIVAIKMPAHAIDELELIVPDDSREKIESQGYDLLKLKKQVQESGYLPQIVFSCAIGLRNYKVWLE